MKTVKSFSISATPNSSSFRVGNSHRGGRCQGGKPGESRKFTLTYFLENQGIALSREKILNSVWNYDYFGDARTIDTHVKKLRSKIGAKGEYIKTIWGMGYKFEVS